MLRNGLAYVWGGQRVQWLVRGELGGAGALCVLFTLKMRQFSCLQDRELFVGVSFGDSDEDEDAAAAEAHSSGSHAALAQAAAVDAVAGAAATDSAATLAVPAPVASPAANPAANSAPAVQPDGGSAAQLRQRATARWVQLLTLTSDERLQRALSPAAAEAAAEAEGLCLVRLPGTRSGLKICGATSSCDPVLKAAALHALAHAHASSL